MTRIEPAERETAHRGHFKSQLDPARPSIDYPYALGAIRETLRQVIEVVGNLEILEILERVGELEDAGELDLELEGYLRVWTAGELLRAQLERAASVLRDYEADAEEIAEEGKIAQEKRDREFREMFGADATSDPDVAEMLGVELKGGDDNAGK